MAIWALAAGFDIGLSRFTLNRLSSRNMCSRLTLRCHSRQLCTAYSLAPFSPHSRSQSLSPTHTQHVFRRSGVILEAL
jgi:hypothetical protein